MRGLLWRRRSAALTIALLAVGGLAPAALADDPTTVLDPHIESVETSYPEDVGDPESMGRGRHVRVYVKGTFLRPPKQGVEFTEVGPVMTAEFTQITFSGTGINRYCCLSWNPTQLVVEVIVDEDATLGYRDVIVTDHTGATDTCESCVFVEDPPA